MYTYFVGDIHGCFDEYLELEARIHKHAHEHGKRSLIVSVGDLIDRGPDSAGVVTHFLNGQQQGTHAAIMGNHEMMLLQVVQHFAPQNFIEGLCPWPVGFSTLTDLHQRGGTWVGDLDLEPYAHRTAQMWLSQGGQQTLMSLEQDPFRFDSWRLPAHWLKYLVELPFYWEDAHTVVTHALISQGNLNALRKSEDGKWPLDAEHRTRLVEAHDEALWNRKLPSERMDTAREHVSGHTPLPILKRHHTHHAVQIDTGCVYGQHLTAYCPELGEALVVKAHRAYARI